MILYRYEEPADININIVKIPIPTGYLYPLLEGLGELLVREHGEG